MTLTNYSELVEATRGRIEYVVSRGEDLASEIQDWLARCGLAPEAVIAEDRLSWELRLRLAEPPPLRRWGHVFGDAVGGLRSTLNNMIWGIAEVEGIQPQRPKMFQFPIAETQREWKSERDRIQELSPVATSAIEKIQPFQRSGPTGNPADDPLLLLRRLSNRDKHELALIPDVSPQEIGHQFSVEFGSEEEAAAEGPPRTEIAAVFEDGATLLRQVTAHPIVKVRGAHTFRGKVVVLDPPRRPVGITSDLAAMCGYVEQVCGYVLAEVTRS